jgi:hypothetical protein
LFLLGLESPLLWGISQDAPGPILVINEIMKDPSSVTDSHGEYVEIYNPDSSAVDLNGWAIMDLGSDYHVIGGPGPLIVEPHSFFVLARDSSIAENGGFSADYQYDSFTLSNGSDEVILLDPIGEVVDSVGYDSSNFPDDPGCSMELRNPGFNNVHGYNWVGADTSFGMGDLGTPGRVNSGWEEYKDMTLDVAVDSIGVRAGESSELEFYVTAQSVVPVNGYLLADLWLPGGDQFGNNPVYGPASLFFDAGDRLVKVLKIDVPYGADTGNYLLQGHLLDSAGLEIDSEEVTINVYTAAE